MLKEMLLKKLRMQSGNVSNAIIQLGDIDDSGKGKRFKSRFIQPGLAGYPGQYGNVLVKKETLDNSLNTIIGAPVIINHKDITPENADNERVGVISDAYYNDKDGWYWCEGVIWDETAQNLINDKKWSVSCSYDFLEQDDAGGTENNIPYDREFTKLNFVHLALVNNPRYERANIVFNSKTVENSFEGHKGRKGQVGGSLPRSNTMPTNEDYKNPLKDYELPAISQEIFKKLNKSEKPIILKKNIIEKNKNNHPEVNIEEYNDILSKGLYQTDVVFKTKNDDDYFNFVHYDKNSNSQVLVELSENKDNYEIVNFYKLSDKSIQRKLKQAIKRIDNEGGQVLIDIEDKTSKVGDLSNLEIDSIHIITDIQEDFNPTGENMLNNVENENWKTLYDKNGEPYHVDLDDNDKTEYKVKKTTVKLKDGKEKEIEYIDKPPKGWEKNEGATTAPRGYDWYTNGKSVLTGERKSILVKDNSKIFTQDIDDFVKRQQKDIDDGELVELGNFPTKFTSNYPKGFTSDNKTHNAKETDMALLDELKKLINTVENGKSEDEEPKKDDDGKKEVDNEKVDKRKLIDEVGGMLKGKVDEELWRTIIGKIEKAAYEKSEAGTADNAEPKKDEKEYKEFKEEVKEDVKNRKKCDNGVDNSKPDFFTKMNEVYSASMKMPETSQYVSRADKLKEAEEYFGGSN